LSDSLRFKKLRLWISYPFAGICLVFAYKYGISFIPGIWFIFTGLILRLWAAGYIQKIRRLTTCGPYSFVRNPLYVGNFLIGIGFCLFIGNIILILLYIVLFFLFYLGTMKKEEKVLEDLFGKDYLEYKKNVPAFIPRLLPYKAQAKGGYTLEQAHYNGELIRILVAGILLCLLYFFKYGVEQEMLDTDSTEILAGLVFLQVLLLVVTIIHRKRFIKKQDAN